MTKPTDFRHRLQRDGTSQSQRRLGALDPATAPVDGRDVRDFLAFAQRLAQRVIYKDLNLQDQGDWESFFGCDESVVIAAIEKTNPLPIRTAVRDALTGSAHPESLRQIFTQLADLARRLNDWREGVGITTGLREQIDRRITANLARTWRRLVGYHRAAADRFPAVPFNPELYRGFSAVVWDVEAPQNVTAARRNETLDPDDVPPDFGLFGGFDSPEDQIRGARTQLEALFVPLYSVLLNVIGLAPRHFDQSLERRDVEPHLGLFIAFLKLYLQLRDDANGLGRKHLEFFYERVLNIKRRPADADQVHVVFELARQVAEEHRIVKGALLDAGADKLGAPVVFATDEDLVVNKAQIEQFRTVFVQYDRTSPEAAAHPDGRIAQRVFAAEAPNSQEAASWPTFGRPESPEAILGFAFASRALLLAEGKRTITLTIAAIGLPGKPLPSNALTAELSGVKGWFQPDTMTATFEDVVSAVVDGAIVRSGTLKLVLELASTAESVSLADSKALGTNFGTSDPIVKITVRIPSPSSYGLLKDLRWHNATIQTDVEGVTTFVIQNDLFAMDPAKPFEPFGPAPARNSNFYVGSAELFEKDLTRLEFDVVWDALPENFKDHYQAYDEPSKLQEKHEFKANAAVLMDGKFESLDDVAIFENAMAIKGLAKIQRPRRINQLAAWTPATQNGFLRLRLTDPGQALRHAKYISVVTRQSLAQARMPECMTGALYKFGNEIRFCSHTDTMTTAEVLIPAAPYTPTIKEFKANYSATIGSHAKSEAMRFFHIEPFGHKAVALPSGDTRPALVPQFDHQGTLYIGLRHLKPLQSLSVLFQVAEATADAEVVKPPIQWSYLADNEWLDFKEFEVASDTTRGLITSGIVTFSIPQEMTAGNTRLPGEFKWLRAAVLQDPQGVSELIGAHTQAVRATFVDNGNDPARLAEPLPAETIGGLVIEDSGIARVSQPYDSFGGRTVESGLTFYNRVAEHLRHKGRAITPFDYERLVLEHFPQLYKAKCINHTNADHAIAPGHLLVAVIPDFRQLKAVNRFRPKVTRDVLDKIEAFLASRNCPFVRNDRRDGRRRLHVLNPVYEEVRVAFKVRFRPEVTALAFHCRELDGAINRFLSPWAFDDLAEITFGGRVYKSSILNFVEEQDYVDYVTEFVMTRRVATSGDGQPGVDEDLDAIEATTPRSILVPAPSHGIEVLAAPSCEATQTLPSQQQIGEMTVGAGFEVAPPDVGR